MQSQGLIKINIENIQNVGQAIRTEVKRSANRNKCFSIRGSKEREKNCIKSACLAKCEAISLMAIYLCCLQYRLTWAICVWMFSNFWGSQNQSKFSFVFSMRLYCCCYLFYYCGHLCVCALAHVIMRANTRVCYEVLRFVSEFAIWCGFFFASILNFALLLFCVSFTFVCLCFYRFLLTFIGVCGIGYVLD